jgi:hypothetical protein
MNKSNLRQSRVALTDLIRKARKNEEISGCIYVSEDLFFKFVCSDINLLVYLLFNCSINLSIN